MSANTDPAINRAYEILTELSQDDKARMIAEDREKAYRDYVLSIEYEKRNAEHKKAMKSATIMLADRLDMSLIEKYTGLSKAEIERIARENANMV